MLKPGSGKTLMAVSDPAAFRRLCVETIVVIDEAQNIFPAAFRRLCVETVWLVAPFQAF